uniref:Bradykinin-potentiating peptide T n=1 Tax=Tityus serrulatus TaxID=6887 RepID=NDB11_TITSE|nr:RecName: Full=Bradykinin-potentiating peptide T; Short=BPP-T; AltName: Full=Non-disulfide-bridged peptide 1.1; Short=NDBP-1.1; AltName: Full=Ts10 [Tityus serrulatus]AAB28453.1 peptide T=bradykinin potentiator [Tityus serrulatus=scorpions, venom, Peptide, 13 aa] [Tityus serrulatus]
KKDGYPVEYDRAY